MHKSSQLTQISIITSSSVFYFLYFWTHKLFKRTINENKKNYSNGRPYHFSS